MAVCVQKNKVTCTVL